MSQDPQPSHDPKPEKQVVAKPRKRRRWPWVILGLILCWLIGALGPTIAQHRRRALDRGGQGQCATQRQRQDR